MRVSLVTLAALCLDTDNKLLPHPEYPKQTKLMDAAERQSASDGQPSPLQNILNPDPSELPDDFNMPIWDHLEELRERCIQAA